MQAVQLVLDAIEELGSSQLFCEMAQAALSGQLGKRPAAYELLLSSARNLRVEHTSSWRFGEHLMTLLCAASQCRSGKGALAMMRGPASKVGAFMDPGSHAVGMCVE
jgi:hypothetical protein